MFDIGFTEMMLIAVVALVVIGPERLPKVARTIGHLFGRAQRYVTDVKSEINREMEIDELRRLQAEMQTAARKVESDFTSSVRDAEESIRKETRLDDVQKEVSELGSPASNLKSSDNVSALDQEPAAPDQMESELDRAIAQADALHAENEAKREAEKMATQDKSSDAKAHALSPEPKPTSSPL